ncbi:MAG: FHA domain-containing protein [Dehalococcoidia bacterium]|nr:FHA domain-containing protein [Dehalococcoidia bacterium]
MTTERSGTRARLLVAQAGGEQEVEFEAALTVGRSRDNDLVVEGADVSRHHARFDSDEGGYSVTDLGSANGTTLNGQKLTPRVPVLLRDGDVVLMGGVRLSFFGPPGMTQAGATMVAAAEPVAARPPEPNATVVALQRPRVAVTTPKGTRNVVLDRDELILGRDPSCDVVVDHESVSARHARIRRTARGWVVEDLDSRFGLFVDANRVSEHILSHGDMVRIGPTASLRFETVYGPDGPVEERVLPLRPGKEITVGRATECDCVIAHPTVSRLHARIAWQDGGHTRVIEDLGSSNGTFVNGARIEPGRPHELRPGDVIRIGPMRLLLSETGLATSDDSQGVRLDAVRLNQRVSPTVNLLQDLSFSIHPREFVAVVGVSGAGKSTLLGALSGFRPASEGAVLVNGVDLYHNFDSYRTSIGYVPQDDILHKELPVKRALEYAAELRLPSDTTEHEHQQRVGEVIQTLDLSARAEVPIVRLSGGQRKRVSIGAELLTSPSLFYLDEATSGLDPGTESQLMRLLRKLADDGHTIILITHATKNVMLCDQVVFLARGGHLAYYGPPEEALSYFGVEDFDGIYEKLEGESTPEAWAAKYRQSPQYAEYAVGRLASIPGAAGQGGGAAARTHKPPRRANPFKQLTVLSRRYIDIIKRDRTNLLLLFLLAPVLGLVDFVWPRDALAFAGGDSTRALVMLFLSAIIPFLVGALSSVREIVKEHAIYVRERTVTLGIGPYLLSKVSVGFLFALYHAFALFVIKALWLEFPDAAVTNYVQLYVTIALAVMSGVMWGLLISALAPREEQAMLLVIGIVVVHIVFSGGLLSLGEMGVAGRVLGAITSTNWVFRGLVTAAQVRTGVCEPPALAECRLPGFAQYTTDEQRNVAYTPIDDRYGDIFGTEIWVCWVGLLSIMAVLFVALYVLQKRKDVV